MTAILEDVKEIVIDKWGTLNTVASPQKLPEGHSPDNQNVWMDEKPGSIVTANGYIKLGEIPSGNPPTLLLNYFKTSDGSSQLIVSDNATVWSTTDYANYTEIKTGLSRFFQLRAKVIRDKVWFTNGSDSVFTWNGSSVTELDGTGGTPDVPLGKYIEYHDERVWLYGIASDLSAVRFSALADSSGTEITPDDADAWPTDNEIQISEGDADQGTGIFLYRGYLYCSKQYSIWRIVGYDEYTYSRVKTRSSTGTRFQESVGIKDDLVHFVGVDGLYQFDGENSVRISDIIDPSSSEGVFAFRNLQQNLLNGRFWSISTTSDINSGTVPNNIGSTNDKISLLPADNTNDDFNGGTHDDTVASGHTLLLDIVTSGGSTDNISQGKSSSLTSAAAAAQLGSASMITDGAFASNVGFNNTSNNNILGWAIDLGSTLPVGRAVIRGLYIENLAQVTSILISSAKIQSSTDNSNWTDRSTITLNGQSSGGTLVFQSGYQRYAYIDTADYTVDFSTASARYWRLMIQGNVGAYVVTEVQIFRAGYEADGKFISSAIDYGSVPESFGALAAAIDTNGETYQFFTQSSADGSTWDSEVNVANGGHIGSTLRRYLRWGVYLYSSNGLNTPVIDLVYVGGTYISPVHNTGGSILQWGAFQLDGNSSGQSIRAYFRAATTSGGVSSASWTALAPGAIPSTAVTNTFIQIKIEMETADTGSIPFVNGFTVNWVLASSSGAAVLQNVASIVILNRYWLTAATLGATENDIVIVYGKSTFQSPWHKKDFKFLSFCRFLDFYIAGSSEDGSIYRLEYGYSKNGEALDAYYETRDIAVDNFQIRGLELLVTTDKLGPYDLTIGWSTDGGLTYTERDISLERADGQSLGFTKRLNINFLSDTVRFRVRINDTDKPFSVDEIRCYYRQLVQRATISS